MDRGGFLRGLFAAPAVAIAAVHRESCESVERTEVLSMHANADCAASFRASGPGAGTSSKLAWSHDADGNWYAENTATGKVTKL